MTAILTIVPPNLREHENTARNYNRATINEESLHKIIEECQPMTIMTGTLCVMAEDGTLR